MTAIRDALAVARLPGDSGRLEAELLLCHCLGKSRSYLYTWPERELPAAVQQRYEGLLHARREGTPLAYLTGKREFWSLELLVNEHTLIPRPETETLVEWALELALPGTARVVDWGTGSGAIALALASERPDWQVLATDVSAAALAVAAANRQRLGLARLDLLRADWGAPFNCDRFDLVVSNPPYVAPGDPHLAQGDLRFEPSHALVAEADGLGAIQRLVDDAARCLVPGGWLLVEHGYNQAAEVQTLFAGAGFDAVTTRSDLAGSDRITGGRLP